MPYPSRAWFAVHRGELALIQDSTQHTGAPGGAEHALTPPHTGAPALPAAPGELLPAWPKLDEISAVEVSADGGTLYVLGTTNEVFLPGLLAEYAWWWLPAALVLTLLWAGRRIRRAFAAPQQRDRLYCPACNHEVDPARARTAHTCPECGGTLDPAHKKHRPRKGRSAWLRAIPAAAIGVVLCGTWLVAGGMAFVFDLLPHHMRPAGLASRWLYKAAFEGRTLTQDQEYRLILVDMVVLRTALDGVVESELHRQPGGWFTEWWWSIDRSLMMVGDSEHLLVLTPTDGSAIGSIDVDAIEKLIGSESVFSLWVLGTSPTLDRVLLKASRSRDAEVIVEWQPRTGALRRVATLPCVNDVRAPTPRCTRATVTLAKSSDLREFVAMTPSSQEPHMPVGPLRLDWFSDDGTSTDQAPIATVLLDAGDATFASSRLDSTGAVLNVHLPNGRHIRLDGAALRRGERIELNIDQADALSAAASAAASIAQAGMPLRPALVPLPGNHMRLEIAGTPVASLTPLGTWVPFPLPEGVSADGAIVATPVHTLGATGAGAGRGRGAPTANRVGVWRIPAELRTPR